MFRRNRPDPYNGFKDDHERRLALNTKARCYAMATVVVALCGAPINWTHGLQWLMSLWP
jgi:hypothetical protein